MAEHLIFRHPPNLPLSLRETKTATFKSLEYFPPAQFGRPALFARLPPLATVRVDRASASRPETNVSVILRSGRGIMFRQAK